MKSQDDASSPSLTRARPTSNALRITLSMAKSGVPLKSGRMVKSSQVSGEIVTKRPSPASPLVRMVKGVQWLPQDAPRPPNNLVSPGNFSHHKVACHPHHPREAYHLSSLKAGDLHHRSVLRHPNSNVVSLPHKAKFHHFPKGQEPCHLDFPLQDSPPAAKAKA